MNIKTLLLVISFAATLGTYAVAEESETDWLQRETLTGEWGGARDRLSEKGIKFEMEFTGYYQGTLSGDGYTGFDFGSRADSLISFNLEKLGLWKGGGFNTHLTYRSGDLPAFRGGALWPVNTGSIAPLGGEDSLVATSLYFTQRLTDSGLLFLGKINALDLLAGDPFFGGWGNHRFMNLAFTAPPSGVVPPVIMGAILSWRVAPYTVTFMIFDPNDHTDDYWFNDLFSAGVNLSLGVKWDGMVFKRTSSINLSATYSTEDSTDNSEILLPPDLKTGTKDGAYSISVQVNHLLLESSVTPGKGLGLYAKAAIADGNPNPIQGSFIGGFAGQRIVPGRPRDTFGIGYFYYNFSNELQSAVTPLITFENEQGIEVFYNIAVSPWLHITVDLQCIDPGTGGNADAWIGGLRTNIRF
nr:carbohydrate porin [uncultured Desulfobacter sp.]